MFTGLIEELGTIKSIEKDGTNIHFEVQASVVMDDIKLGDSIAIDGVCQTVTKINNDGANNPESSFWVTAVVETLNVTNFRNFKLGTKVNLERCLRVGDRLGGHIVQGHVDSTAEFVKLVDQDGSYDLYFKIPKEFGKYIIRKGSVCISGTSLTVVDVDRESEGCSGEAVAIFYVTIIPKTWEATNLSRLEIGDLVNIEYDVLVKHLEALHCA